MSLKYYDSYISKIAQEPVDDWRDLMQANIDDTWENTSTVTNVLGQTQLGFKTFACESVQLNSVIDPKTGNSLGDEYRKIIYKNYKKNQIKKDLTKTERFLGKYYQFDDYTWLTINTNTIIGSDTSAILQKCNNILKWYDKSNILHVWPCVFERKLSGTNFDWGSEGVAEVNADTIIKVQLNSETNLIPINQRFLFDGHAFQVKQINNHISDTYLELYIFETQIQSNDDIENNIANVNGQVEPEKFETVLLPKINKILQGYTQIFSIYKYIDGEKTNDIYNVFIEGPTAGLNYVVNIIDGNNFSIENLLSSDTPLTLTCVNANDSSDVITQTMILGGLW